MREGQCRQSRVECAIMWAHRPPVSSVRCGYMVGSGRRTESAARSRGDGGSITCPWSVQCPSSHWRWSPPGPPQANPWGTGGPAPVDEKADGYTRWARRSKPKRALISPRKVVGGGGCLEAWQRLPALGPYQAPGWGPSPPPCVPPNVAPSLQEGPGHGLRRALVVLRPVPLREVNVLGGKGGGTAAMAMGGLSLGGR